MFRFALEYVCIILYLHSSITARTNWCCSDFWEAFPRLCMTTNTPTVFVETNHVQCFWSCMFKMLHNPSSLEKYNCGDVEVHYVTGKLRKHLDNYQSCSSIRKSWMKKMEKSDKLSTTKFLTFFLFFIPTHTHTHVCVFKTDEIATRIQSLYITIAKPVHSTVHFVVFCKENWESGLH